MESTQKPVVKLEIVPDREVVLSDSSEDSNTGDEDKCLQLIRCTSASITNNKPRYFNMLRLPNNWEFAIIAGNQPTASRPVVKRHIMANKSDSPTKKLQSRACAMLKKKQNVQWMFLPNRLQTCSDYESGASRDVCVDLSMWCYRT